MSTSPACSDTQPTTTGRLLEIKPLCRTLTQTTSSALVVAGSRAHRLVAGQA
jgi:hypothetical protein